MEIQQWKLEKIIPYSRNAKKHHQDWITASVRDFKPDQPIVVDADGVIIKGHGRLEAAKQLGMKTFPVIVRDDLTPEQVRLSRIADNRSAEVIMKIKRLSNQFMFILKNIVIYKNLLN